MERSDAVEVLVNFLRQGVDLGAELSLDLEHVVLIIVRHEVYGKTVATESA